MYKYTADSSVIHKFNCLKKKPRGYDKVFDFALSVVGDSSAYFACGDFWRHYEHCAFYSNTRRKHIPINGVLVHVDWFVEEKI